MGDKGTWFTDEGQDLQRIFHTASGMAPGDERARYLDRVCGEYPELRAKVEDLLEAQADAGDFMADDESPAGDWSPPPAIQLGTAIGPYKLLEPIGEGGMGSVYMAEQTEPVERRVALKIIKPGMDSGEIIARFEAERQALAMMDHPGIAKVFDAGATETGLPYFVMELVKGIPITEYCDRRELDPRERLELFVRLCHAVQHAHQKGIIHRDLKPANVLVADYDDEPVPKVIDFGIAKATGPKLTEKTMHTKLGQIVGTLEYMSPEQAKLDQLDIDTRSDIYALGVLLYELLTGTTPFERGRFQVVGFEEILRIIREEEPPKPSTRISTLGDKSASVTTSRGSDARQLRNDLRGELDWIVMRAMEKDRNRRYDSAAALADDIQRFLSSEPVHACPPSTAYRVKKFVRRHKGPVIAATAVLLVLLIGLAGTGYGLIEATAAEEKAVRVNFRMALDRGLTLCDEGHVGHGMLWLARALELCPEDDPAMERAVRANLNAWRQELNSLEAIFPHDEAVTGVAFSPDGGTLLTGSNDDTAQRWDLRTGERIGSPLRHSGDTHELAFSADGARILTSDYGSTAFLWDARSGERIWKFQLRKKLVPGAAFRPPHDRQVVTSDGAGDVRVWDVESGAELAPLPHHPHLVHDVAFSADGSRVLTACHDTNARVYEFESRRLLAILRHETRVPTADFCGRDNGLVATGDSDGNVFVWNLAEALADADGVVELSVVANQYVEAWRHEGGIHRLRAHRDGTRFLTASFDNTARIWDPHAGAVGTTFEHMATTQAAVFTGDGSRIATACDDAFARVWRPAAGPSVRVVELGTLEGHEAVYTADGRYIVTRVDPATMLLRDVATRARICEFPYEGGLRGAAVSADGSRLLIAGASQTGRILDTTSGEDAVEPFQHRSAVWAVDLDPDGTRTLTGDFYGVIQIHDAGTGDPVYALEVGSRIWGVVFSPDGARIAAASSDNRVRVFDTAAWDRPPLVLAGHQGAVAAVAFSRDGKRIVTGSHDNTARVWDAATGKPVSEFMPHRGPLWYRTMVAFSPDGRTVVTGCDDRTVRVWDVATAKPIGPVLRHAAGVRLVAFENDAQIRTGTTTGTVRFWQPTLAPLTGDVERIRVWIQVRTGLALDPDGALQSLDADTWHELRARLIELGGEPAAR